MMACVMEQLCHGTTVSWNNQMNTFRYKLLELSVSAIRLVQSISMLIWLQLISEFTGQLDDGFCRPLVVRYSDKANSPLENVHGKINNRIRGAQRLSSCTYSCGGVALSFKEVTWVSRYTENIFSGRKLQGSELLQRATLCVKLTSSLIIYGIWLPEHR